MENNFDVIIAGGGLAGLTLGIQLKNARPSISICIVESSNGDHKVSAHKVGESTVELGTYYLREVLGLADYLDQDQLPKHGLRFFLSPEHKENIDKRYEIGPILAPPTPSHQLDRGIFENELIRRNQIIGNVVRLAERVNEAILNKDGHKITVNGKSESTTLTSKWFVDTTGRSSFLKKQFNLAKDINHDINAVWFRLKGIIDITDWSDNADWKNQLGPGLRRLSTTHLMGEGYWVWLIPLVTGNTSVGIVADPRYHEFKSINRLDNAIQWLEKFEPQCAKHITAKRDDILDFKILKSFAYNTTKLFSEDKWCLSGESGVFLDPFYSPGTDFISLSNTWITDLISKDLNGEEIYVQNIVYEKVFQAMIENWAGVYRNKYPLFGSTEIMATKIIWDWANYWSIQTLMFMNNGYTNMNVLKTLFFGENGLGVKLAALNTNIQSLFVNWQHEYKEEIKATYLDPFEIDFLKELHLGLSQKYNEDELIEKIKTNINLLEQIGAEIIRHVVQKTKNINLSDAINPYHDNIVISEIKEEDKIDVNIAIQTSIQKDWQKVWMPQKVNS